MKVLEIATLILLALILIMPLLLIGAFILEFYLTKFHWYRKFMKGTWFLERHPKPLFMSDFWRRPLRDENYTYEKDMGRVIDREDY